jgi:hypothetical protein
MEAIPREYKIPLLIISWPHLAHLVDGVIVAFMEHFKGNLHLEDSLFLPVLCLIGRAPSVIISPLAVSHLGKDRLV